MATNDGLSFSNEQSVLCGRCRKHKKKYYEVVYCGALNSGRTSTVRLCKDYDENSAGTLCLMGMSQSGVSNGKEGDGQKEREIEIRRERERE